MDNRAEIREFLATRRARLTPEQVGLPAGGGRRRVPGLRREEVAVVAGVSTDWYIRLERGHINGVSEDVLDAVAGALRLDDAERAHLFDLARSARPTRAPRRQSRAQMRPSYPDWDQAAHTSVALLRTEAGRDPHNRDLTTLTFHHPVVGHLELAFDAMDLPADPGLTLTAYSADRGLVSEDGLRLLASWGATVAPSATTTTTTTIDNPAPTPSSKDR